MKRKHVERKLSVSEKREKREEREESISKYEESCQCG